MKKRLNKFITLIIVCCLTLCTNPSLTMACVQKEYYQMYAQKTIMRVDNYVWVYKIMNGKLYGRLYNEKTGKFVGDWILIE